MRYGLLALSMTMLTGGGVAAQSALGISNSAQFKPALASGTDAERTGITYGALPFTAARSHIVRTSAD